VAERGRGMGNFRKDACESGAYSAFSVLRSPLGGAIKDSASPNPAIFVI
jgi:hypothetical protein